MTVPCFSSLDVKTSDDGSIVSLTLNHGKANEMGTAQLRDLELLVGWLKRPDGPRALITRSEKVSRRGTAIFVAGANVTERAQWSDEQVKAHVRWQRDVLRSLREAPVFHIALVEGVALGWGTEFLLTADYRICTSEASFALPETGLGIVPGAGGTSELWAHIGVAQALRLGMTGERISADESVRIGLTQELLPTSKGAMERAHQLAQRVLLNSPTAVAAFKSGVLSACGASPEDRHQIELNAYETCVNTGQAAVGRAHFSQIRQGVCPPWGDRLTEDN